MGRFMASLQALSSGFTLLVLSGNRHRQVFAESSCTTVDVSGVGDFSGTYTQVDGLATSWIRPAGLLEYYISGRDGLWAITPGGSRTYPQYFCYDPALHPADITLEWGLLSTSLETSPAPSPVLISCEDSTTSSGGGDAPAPSDGSDTTQTAQPTTSDEDLVLSGSSASNTEEQGGDNEGDDGDNENGLATGTIVGITLAILAALGGAGFALKHNQCSFCSRHDNVTSAVNSSA